MSLLAAYLNSPAMAQHVLATGDGTTPDEVKFATDQLTYAALRWHQLFENANVDAKQINLQPLKHSDFMLYLEAATNLLKKPQHDGESFRESVNDLLRAASFKAFNLSPEQILDPVVGNDYHQRLVALLTMGACKFHDGNQPHQIAVTPYFRDPKQRDTQIAWHLQYLKNWGPEKTIQDLLHGDCYQGHVRVHDEKVDLTDAEIIDLPTAQSISQQIVRSQANALSMER